MPVFGMPGGSAVIAGIGLAVAGAMAPGLAAAAAPATTPATQAEVVIYRCTDAQGRLSLRSSPCPAGETQAVKRMTRPQDAPPRPAARPTAPAASPPAVIASPAYRPAPRPLYACQSADGRSYLSDSANGSPRMVPQWVAVGAPAPQPPPGPPGPPLPPSPRSDGLRPGRVDAQLPQDAPRAVQAPVRRAGGAYGAGYGSHAGAAYGGSFGIVYNGSHGTVSAGIHGGVHDGHHGGHHTAGSPLLVYGGTGLAYDRCERLPAAVACARLRAEHDALGRAVFNAPPGGRDALQAEREALAAWLAEDCR